MYSQEDREFALDMWFSLWPSISEDDFVAELGWPSRTCLKNWIMQDPRFDPDKPRHDSKPILTKLEAIRRVSEGASPREAAQEAGVSENAVRLWVGSFAGAGTAGLLPKRGGGRMAEAKSKKVGKPVPALEERPSCADPLPDDPEELRAMVERLRMDNAILREVLDVLKADPSLDPGTLTSAERTRIVATLEGRFPLDALRGRVGIAKSTYYYQLDAITDPHDKYAALDGRVLAAFLSSGGVYGSESIWASLRAGGGDLVRAADLAPGDMETPVLVSEKVVRDSMRRQGLVAAQPNAKGSGGYRSWEGEKPGRPGNVPLNEDGSHDFSASRPMKLVVTDVSEFKLDGFKVYLSPALDCYDGCPVAWDISPSADRRSPMAMLRTVQSKRRRRERLTVHTDGGGVYFTEDWIAFCEEHGIDRSMSRPGHSGDNARMEGFFGTLKNDFFRGRDWDGVGYGEFVAELDAYLVWYRDCKIKKSLGWKSISQSRAELGYTA